MSQFIDTTVATDGKWHVVPATQSNPYGVPLPTFAIVATGDCEQFVGKVHPIDGVSIDRPKVQMNARLFAASKPMAELLQQAVAFEADLFRADEPVSGPDLLEFFAKWRISALRILEGWQE